MLSQQACSASSPKVAPKVPTHPMAVSLSEKNMADVLVSPTPKVRTCCKILRYCLSQVSIHVLQIRLRLRTLCPVRQDLCLCFVRNATVCLCLKRHI